MIVVGCVASQFTVRRTSLRPTSFMSVKKAAPWSGCAERVIVGDADREAGLGRARERKRCAGESKGESEPLHPSSFLGRAADAAHPSKEGRLDSTRGDQGRHQRLRPDRAELLPRVAGEEPGLRARRRQRPRAAGCARAHAQVRLDARSAEERDRPLRERDLGRRPLLPRALGARRLGAALEGHGRRRRRRVDGALHRPRGRLAASDRRRVEGRHLGAGDATRTSRSSSA